VKATW